MAIGPEEVTKLSVALLSGATFEWFLETYKVGDSDIAEARLRWDSIQAEKDALPPGHVMTPITF